MDATVQVSFYKLLSYGSLFPRQLLTDAFTEIRKVIDNPAGTTDEKWYSMRCRLSHALRTTQYDPASTVQSRAAWVLMKLNAHAEKRHDDFKRTDINPSQILRSPNDITKPGFFPNHLSLPDHDTVRSPAANYNENKFVRSMLRDGIAYGEEEIQNTAYCMFSEMMAGRNLETRVKLPNILLPSKYAEICGTSPEMLTIIGKIRGMQRMDMVEDVFITNRMRHVYTAIVFVSYARKTGKNVKLVPLCARHAEHPREINSVLVHVSETDLIIQGDARWISVVPDINDNVSVLNTFACVFKNN